MWFDELATADDPRRDDLYVFVDAVVHFLADVLRDDDHFSFLWDDAPALRLLAIETFEYDVRRGASELKDEIPRISQDNLLAHGLIGRPMRFKFQVLVSIAGVWGRAGEAFAIRDWLKRIIDAIDAILDSLIDAAGGVGAVIKEFKDALSALVSTG